MLDGITETNQRNVEGRAQAMTVMTPIKPFMTAKVHLVFWSVEHLHALTEPLRALSFIHYARWNIVEGIPFNGGTQKPEKLHYNYLLFTTNFNGTWEQYIDAFSRYCPDKMDLVWGTSFGHPGAAHTLKFKEYIRANEFPASHYYSAYPDAPTTMILQALSLEQQFEEFRRHTADLGPEEFQAAYLAFLTDVRGCFDGIDLTGVRFKERVDACRTPADKRTGLTILTPIEIGSEAILRAWIEALPEGEDSPFAQLPGTHFARLVVLDQLRYEGEPQRQDRLNSQYLLFESNFDSHDLDAYLADLCARIPDVVHQVWGRCAGFPGTADVAGFQAYMRHNQIPVTFFYTAYPNATLEDVRRALRFREQFTRFAVEAQGKDARTLQESFRATFG